MRTLASALLLALLQDPAPLRWSLKKGQTFKLVTKSWTGTRVLWDDKEQYKEDRTDAADFAGEVVSIDAEGRALLRFRLATFSMDADRGEFHIVGNSKRQEKDEPEVTMEIASEKLSAPVRDLMDRIFRTAFKNLYGITIDVTIDRSGSVVDVKSAGDLFEGLKIEGQAAKILTLSAREMIDRDEIASTLAAQSFLSLPEQAKAGEPWDTTRAYGMRGIDMKGKFKASIKSAADGFAQIEETGKYALDATRYGVVMTTLTKLLLPEADIAATMTPGAQWPVENTWWFGQQSGRVESFNCKGSFSVEGEVNGTFKGKEAKSRVKVERDLTLSVRWE